jgi:heme-degrading monooxygenase HmoA
MVTVITRVVLQEGSEPEWDAAMRERLEMARTRPGWVEGQLLMPFEKLNERLVVGTWRTRAEWEAWHEDEGFKQTRERLEGLQSAPSEMSWYEVIEVVADSETLHS